MNRRGFLQLCIVTIMVDKLTALTGYQEGVGSVALSENKNKVGEEWPPDNVLHESANGEQSGFPFSYN